MLVAYFIYSSVYVSIVVSQFIPPPVFSRFQLGLGCFWPGKRMLESARMERGVWRDQSQLWLPGKAVPLWTSCSSSCALSGTWGGSRSASATLRGGELPFPLPLPLPQHISFFPWHLYRIKDVACLVAQTVENLPAVQETQVWSLGQEDPLEKRTATHSSILAWRIPWTEKPSRLQPMGSQRAGHDWATFTFLSCKTIGQHGPCCGAYTRWKTDPPFPFRALSWCVLGEMCLKEVLYSDERKGFLGRVGWAGRRRELAPDLEGKRWRKNLPLQVGT